jgi:hypothetical protein
MIKVSVCYSNKHGSEFASCSVADMEFHPVILDDPHGFTNEVLKAYHRCQSAVEAQLEVDADGNPTTDPERPSPPRAQSAPPAGQPNHAPRGNPGNGQYGPPKSARTFCGWIAGDGKQHKDRAIAMCKAQGYSTMFRDLTDDQAMWIYHSLTAVPAVQPAWGGPPLAANGSQAY